MVEQEGELTEAAVQSGLCFSRQTVQPDRGFGKIACLSYGKVDSLDGVVEPVRAKQKLSRL